MKYIAIFLILCACSPLTRQQKTENKVARKLEKIKAKYPEAYQNVITVKVDTLIKEVEVKGETRIDTLKTEKLVKEYIRDTVQVTQFIKEFLDVTSDTVVYDSLGLHLRISGSNIDYQVKRDSIYFAKEVETVTITNTEVVRRNFWNDWKFYLILALVILVVGAIKQKNYIINKLK